MKSAAYWFVFGVCVTCGVIMMVFGVLFLKDALVGLSMSKGELAFPSLLFGVILLMAGGGLLSSSIANSIRKVCSR